ncbi:hypothetical protein B0T19DRAFT_400013 [Cercophora scortea]|uniref:Uncharacterized protein n=1 Tax=Cercophora scortea TaxID=314031 RepID=A0AAE0IMJ2_9PEZI|nr:hypothetical protein B0T19DRAFT_400013 [Cercophora scortea]
MELQICAVFMLCALFCTGSLGKKGEITQIHEPSSPWQRLKSVTRSCRCSMEIYHRPVRVHQLQTEEKHQMQSNLSYRSGRALEEVIGELEGKSLDLKWPRRANRASF